METAASGAVAAVRRARSDLVGIVRIACPPVSMLFLRDFQDVVSQVHPGLGVELLSARAPADLAKGQADISIRSVRPGDLDLVVAHRFDIGSAVYAATSYLAAHGRPASPAGIAGHRLVRYSEPFLHLAAFNWIEQFSDPAVPALRVDNIDMARSLVAAGDGIGVLFCIAGDTAPGVERVFEDPIDRMTISIVYHEAARGSARLRAVLDLLIQYHLERKDALSGQRPRS